MYSVINDKIYYIDIDKLLEYIKMGDSEIVTSDLDGDDVGTSEYKINTVKWDTIRYMIDALMINDIPEEHDYELNKLPLTKGIAINTLKHYKIVKEYGE